MKQIKAEEAHVWTFENLLITNNKLLVFELL